MHEEVEYAINGLEPAVVQKERAMKTSLRTLAFTNFRTPRWIAVGVLAALAILLTPGISSAANGTWTSTAGGVTTTNNWSDTLKWLPGSVADGAGSLASFSSTITNATYITLDSSRTLGTLYFGVSGVNYWNLNTNSAGAVLTLDNGGVGAQPGISNASSGVVSIYTSLAGTQGLLKSGAGDVRLYSTNTFSVENSQSHPIA